MAESHSPQGSSSGVWSVVAYHDWEDPGGLETTLLDALDGLEGYPGEAPHPLYQSIDVEAVRDVLAPESNRGASEIRFECAGHEIRISEDGTVAVR